MLDWSNAAVGPPAVDVAAMLQSFSFRVDPSLPADDVLAMYAAGLKKCGVDRGQTEVAISARRALVLLIRGMIGWAGQDTHPPPTGRNLALRQASAARAAAAITWLDR
jgi:aminoglycoside phosphotransferase (APT) family kinase protein